LKSRLAIISGTLVLVSLIAAGILYVFWNQAVPIMAMAVNYVRYLSAPKGTISTEVAATSKASPASASSAATVTSSPNVIEGDWPSYNKTLTSNRYSQLIPNP
jgi:alcohol dehydrogenase (cytochrome c)